MTEKLGFHVQVTASGPDYYSLQIDVEQIVVERDSPDLSDVRVIPSSEFATVLSRLGRTDAASILEGMAAAIEAGEVMELVEALQSAGTIEYSRLAADWDF